MPTPPPPHLDPLTSFQAKVAGKAVKRISFFARKRTDTSGACASDSAAMLPRSDASGPLVAGERVHTGLSMIVPSDGL